MKKNGTEKHRPKVLVVDDDAAIVALVADVLVASGMEAVPCTSATEALGKLAQEKPDLALLDVMMPGMDGFELCSRIRQTSAIPIVFLTAKDAESDLVVGLTLGADDYVVKPFRPRELVARIRARLRSTDHADGALVTREFEIDRRGHAALLHGQELDLTPKEFSILAMLVERAGSPVPARELYEHAWEEPYDASAANTVMVHIRHLRQKCEAVDASQPFIDTVWGVGYRIRGEGDAS